MRTIPVFSIMMVLLVISLLALTGCEPGSSGDEGEDDSEEPFAINGYAQRGPWLGTMWTEVVGDGATIAPECNEFGTAPCFQSAGNDIIIAGQLALSYDSYARVNWFINESPPIEPGTWTLSGTGITVSITNSIPATPLRVVLVSDSGDEWCASLTGSGEQSLEWSDFVVDCFDGGTDLSSPPPGTEIEIIAIEVVGDEVFSREFDFRWNYAQPY